MFLLQGESKWPETKRSSEKTMFPDPSTNATAAGGGKFKNRPLRSIGAKYAATDYSVACEVARIKLKKLHPSFEA